MPSVQFLCSVSFVQCNWIGTFFTERWKVANDWTRKGVSRHYMTFWQWQQRGDDCARLDVWRERSTQSHTHVNVKDIFLPSSQLPSQPQQPEKSTQDTRRFPTDKANIVTVRGKTTFPGIVSLLNELLRVSRMQNRVSSQVDLCLGLNLFLSPRSIADPIGLAPTIFDRILYSIPTKETGCASRLCPASLLHCRPSHLW